MNHSSRSTKKKSEVTQIISHDINELGRFIPWGSDNQPHKREMKFPIFSIGLSTFLINILSLALPIALIQTYDRIIPNKSYESLAVLGIIVLGALILELLLKLIRSYILEWSGAVFEHKTYCAAMEHLSKADPIAIDKAGIGSILVWLDKIPNLREFYNYQPVFLLIIDFPFMLIYLGLIWYLGGWLVIPPLVLVCIFILAVWFESGTMYDTVVKFYTLLKYRNNFVIEVLKGIHTIKSFGSESFFMRRYDRLNNTLWQYSHFLSEKMGIIFNQTIVLSQLIIVVVSTTGAILFLNGELALGAFSACILLSYRLIYPIQRSITFLQKMNDIIYYQKSVDSIFNIPLMSTNNTAIKDLKGHIEIQNVTVKFPQTKTPLFKNMSFNVEPNTCISISAEPHSGQTTLLNLISGIIKPDSGTILIDGVPSSDIPRDQYKEVFGYLTTTGEIFQGTIRENLTFFGAHDDKYAEKVARELGIDSITKYLPLGYETQLLDNAADPISPGIKQRISTARILASNAKIILFDHPDSTLDLEGIQYLINYMKTLKKNKTIIILSNDKNILKLADKHYKISNKKISEV